MRSKKAWLKKSLVYAVIDKEILKKKKKTLAAAAKRIKSQGIKLVQLRDKKSKKANVLIEACMLSKILKGSSLFIINDFLDVASICGADGIHLGQDDTSVSLARKIIGKEKIIGVSCHSLKQALKAQSQGADYIGVGPIFKTPLKAKGKPVGLRLLEKIVKKIKIPVFAIGGINRNNAWQIYAVGAKRIAVCRALLEAGSGNFLKLKSYKK
ncbi:MAG: thiamine phosphate synthase [Candidatus Omnitrophota bacterium]|nr:MAG: thiamine phosphate synthase [Candidatus Omnitrophota bacterium]